MAIMSKYVPVTFTNRQTTAQTMFWKKNCILDLPSFTTLCGNEFLITFAILAKNIQKWYFDQIYHLTKYVKNDTLATFTILSKNVK